MSDLESLCASLRSREHAFWTTFIKSCLGRLLFQKSNANLESTITSTDFLMQQAMFSAGQPFLTLFCCACMTALPHCWTQNAPRPGWKAWEFSPLASRSLFWIVRCIWVWTVVFLGPWYPWPSLGRLHQFPYDQASRTVFYAWRHVQRSMAGIPEAHVKGFMSLADALEYARRHGVA